MRHQRAGTDLQALRLPDYWTWCGREIGRDVLLCTLRAEEGRRRSQRSRRVIRVIPRQTRLTRNYTTLRCAVGKRSVLACCSAIVEALLAPLMICRTLWLVIAKATIVVPIPPRIAPRTPPCLMPAPAAISPDVPIIKRTAGGQFDCSKASRLSRRLCPPCRLGIPPGSSWVFN